MMSIAITAISVLFGGTEIVHRVMNLKQSRTFLFMWWRARNMPFVTLKNHQGNSKKWSKENISIRQLNIHKSEVHFCLFQLDLGNFINFKGTVAMKHLR